MVGGRRLVTGNTLCLTAQAVGEWRRLWPRHQTTVPERECMRALGRVPAAGTEQRCHLSLCGEGFTFWLLLCVVSNAPTCSAPRPSDPRRRRPGCRR